MDNLAKYGKRNLTRKEYSFGDKGLYLEFDLSDMDEASFADVLEKAKQKHPKDFKSFITELSNVLRNANP